MGNDTSIVILDGARRTPRADILVNNQAPGLFSDLSATQLGGMAIRATLEHTEVDRGLIGHVVMGMDLTILSMFGLVALTGVVINDSLVMVDYINRVRDRGEPVGVAVRAAGEARFRAILLTSLTTFAGLTPLLLERSVQAQFLVPMAISLAFGVLFATGITLVLVPVLYSVLEDLRGLFVKERREEPEAAPEPASEPA